MYTSKRARTTARTWTPVTVRPTTEETPATAWVPAIAWTRSRAWTPVTACISAISAHLNNKDASKSREANNH